LLFLRLQEQEQSHSSLVATESPTKQLTAAQEAPPGHGLHPAEKERNL